MFDIREGGTEKEREQLMQRRLMMLKRAREAGYFDEEPTEKMPEVTADGHGPDDGWLREPPPERHPGAHNSYGSVRGTPVLPREAPRPLPLQPRQWCGNCEEETRHLTFGIGTPIWHCTVCCTCDWCMQTVEHQVNRSVESEEAQRRMSDLERIDHWEQVVHGRKSLLDAVDAAGDMSFCTKCGAGLRCGVCHGEGTGDYCELCGKKIGEEGFCTDCWKEND